MNNQSNGQQYPVEVSSLLLPFLLKVIDRGRNHTKNILARGQILVDGQVVTAYNYQLKPNQEVTVLKQAPQSNKLTGLTIVHEDQDLLIINKSEGLLTIATGKDQQQTAYRELTRYVRQQNPKNRVFIVHRLDRDTSGLLVFAKNEATKLKLQDNWKDAVEERTYFALVEGKVKNAQGTLTSWLKETKTHQMYVSKTSTDAKEAILHYKRIQTNGKFTLLEVKLDTGRKNQIRVQLTDMGHPVVGDKKYRAQTNILGRLGLHAKVLAFTHPTTNEKLHFEADVPTAFFQKSKG